MLRQWLMVEHSLAVDLSYLKQKDLLLWQVALIDC